MFYPVLDITKILFFLALFSRIIGVFSTAPILGAKVIPVQIKIVLSLIIAYLLFVLFPGEQNMFANIKTIPYLFIIFSETIIGVLIGYVAMMIFTAIQFAGSIIDRSMGMMIASVIDPMSKERQSLTGQLQYIVSILLFLLFNGHHYIILALANSFELLPIGTLHFSGSFIGTFMTIINNSFIIGLKLSAPIVGILFLIDFSLGIIAKSIPQMNVFLTGMPLKSMVGFTILFSSFIYFGIFFGKIPGLTYQNIIITLKQL